MHGELPTDEPLTTKLNMKRKFLAANNRIVDEMRSTSARLSWEIDDPIGVLQGHPLYSNHEAGFFMDKIGGRNSCVF